MEAADGTQSPVRQIKSKTLQLTLQSAQQKNRGGVMTQENRFNLIDEPWIPVTGKGNVSLREIFSRPDLSNPGGSPLEKIALFKLLQAIAQAAITPADEQDWRHLGVSGMAEACLNYLTAWHDAFWLYGPRPFLQFPAVRKAKKISYGSLMPDIASGNTSVLFQSQVEQSLDDAQKALLLLTGMSCCFGGKKVDKSVVLSPGVIKSASAKAGPALCSQGLLHTFLLGSSLRESVWLNLLTQENLAEERLYEKGVGTPPWERMPAGEDDEVARNLKRSLMGRLVPMARFYLLEEDGVHSVEGIQHPDYLQGGMVDPSVTGDRSAKKPRMIWADPQKRPWRMLTALLSFLKRDQKSPMRCLQLYWCVPRIQRSGQETLRLWSGGIRLRSNAGEQYLSGSDDVVESELSLPVFSPDSESGDRDWFSAFQLAMERLEVMGKAVYMSVYEYYRDEKTDNASSLAARASLEFWQMAERHFSALSESCSPQNGPEEREKILRSLYGCVQECYARACPCENSRQMELWARNRPFSRKKKEG